MEAHNTILSNDITRNLKIKNLFSESLILCLQPFILLKYNTSLGLIIFQLCCSLKNKYYPQPVYKFLKKSYLYQDNTGQKQKYMFLHCVQIDKTNEALDDKVSISKN